MPRQKKPSRRTRIRPDRSAELICWIDHAEPLDRPAWAPPTPPDELVPVVVWTSGFVVSENEQIIEVARDYSEYRNAGGPVHILKCAIVYRKRVAVPYARRANVVRL